MPEFDLEHPPWTAEEFGGLSEKWGDEQDRSEWFEAAANEYAGRVAELEARLDSGPKNIVTMIAEAFISACPVGWGIGPDSELTRLDDFEGRPNWHLSNPSEGTDENGGVAEAAQFLLVDCGFGDHEGIHDLVERLRTGHLGGGAP